MWPMFNKMADDVPCEPRTNQTLVSFKTTLDLQHLMLFHDLCLYLSAVI